MHYRYLLALSLAVAAAPALAHDALPSVNWCRDGRAVRVAEFDFDAATLKAFRQCALKPRGGSTPAAICAVLPLPTDDVICPPNQCGEFDDDYHVAKIAASIYCNTQSPFHPDPAGGAGNGDQVIVPLFDSDLASFYADDHHSSYHFGDGARGACMACMKAERDNPTQ